MRPAVSLGAFQFPSWRLVVLAGVVLCWVLLLRRTRRLGHPSGPVLLFLVLELGVGTAGGHLFNVLIPVLFRTPGASLNGLTVIGTTVATLAFAAVYVPRLLKTDVLSFMDAAAFTYPLALAVGRLGCLLNGCCFGTLAPDWAAASPLRPLLLSVSAFDPHTQAAEQLAGLPPGTLVWNLPVLLCLNALLVLLTAETLFRNRQRWGLLPGTVVAAAIAQETLGRFFFEFLRLEPLVGASRFNPWQLTLVALFAFFAGGLAWLLARRGRPSARAA